MTKDEHLLHWVKTATSDWKATEELYKAKCYMQSLFWAHLVLEKLLKAHWIKDNEGNTPPKMHNLLYLAEKTKLELPQETLDFFFLMNQFQLEGRYPDYLQDIFRKYKLVQTKKVLDQVNTHRKCLLKKL